MAVIAAVVALVALAALATATPPTRNVPYAGALTPLTIPIGGRRSGAATVTEAASEAPWAPPPAVLRDPGTPPIPTLAPRSQPAPRVGVVVKPTPLRATSTGHVLRGAASWFCNNDGSRAQISPCHYAYPDSSGFDAYAAAGPKLRAALGGGDRWRNRVVSVDGIAVKLVDWCQCYQGEPNEKIIDLYLDVFRRVGDEVAIRW